MLDARRRWRNARNYCQDRDTTQGKARPEYGHPWREADQADAVTDREPDPSRVSSNLWGDVGRQAMWLGEAGIGGLARLEVDNVVGAIESDAGRDSVQPGQMPHPISDGVVGA